MIENPLPGVYTAKELAAAIEARLVGATCRYDELTKVFVITPTEPDTIAAAFRAVQERPAHRFASHAPRAECARTGRHAVAECGLFKKP